MSLALLSVVPAAGAQCPDGSAPPCSGARPRYVSRSTRQLPDSVRLLFDRAVEEGRRRTAQGARESVDLLTRVIAHDSNYAPAWAALSYVAHQGWVRRWRIHDATPDSLLALALRASRRAVQLDSGLVLAWVTYARAVGIVDVGDRSATRRALTRALEIAPRSVDALFALGVMEEELMRPRAARAAWNRALAINPTHLESVTFLGLHHFWHGEYARARRLVDSALVIDPTYSVAREAAAEVALAERRFADAERHVMIGRRSEAVQEAAVGLTVLARAAHGRGAAEDARRHMMEAERLANLERPTRHEAVFMGAGWAALGDTARALVWLGAYRPVEDLHFQMHLKREPSLQWLRATRSPLLRADPQVRIPDRNPR